MAYGVGQGLSKGVEMLGNLLVPAMRDKMVMDRRERMFDKELRVNAGMLAGQDAAMARPTSGPAMPGAGTPGELLAQAPDINAASKIPSQQAVGAGPLAGVQSDEFSPMSEEEVFNLYRSAAEQRTLNQIRMADEMDVARGWQRSYSSMTNLKRSLGAIQNALKDQSGNAAMVLVPQAQDPDQARQVLSSEYMKLLQQYKPIEQEWKLWDGKRNELGIDPNEINTDPGIAQWLNRLHQRQRGGALARPGAKSVMPAPSRGRPGSGRGY